MDRLRMKLWLKEMSEDPYSQEDRDGIFLEMYRNIEVRKYCEESMIYFDTTLFPNKELTKTLNS